MTSPKAPNLGAQRSRPPIALAGNREPEVVYSDANVSFDPATHLGVPGEHPFTRGIHPSMYRSRLWTMRQYAGFGTASESNERFRMLLAQGQTGLSIAFDLPTQMGYDSDHPKAQGEVGRVGVAIDSLDDMRCLLRDIPLDRVSTSMTINATAAILLAMYVAIADERGTPRAQLRGTIQNDILKEYVARGTYVFGPDASLRLTRDTFAWCAEELPHWNPISVSGYHMREAGCDAAQEIAFTLGNGITYVQTALQAGIPIDRFGEQISFFFNAHSNFLEEVAKFRAARKLWALIMKERFGATSPKACMMRFHAQTAGSSLQAKQPLVNVVRTTVQAMAAILGGCQSLHTNSYDEALSLPTAQSATLALRTQQVLAHESGIADTVDALGGSFAIEQYTLSLEQEARVYLDTLQRMGGMVRAIEAGYVQREIEQSAYRYQLDVEREQRVLVGVNRFTDDRDANDDIDLHEVRADVQHEQCTRLHALRSTRSAHDVQAHCTAITEAAASPNANLMPLILRAVQAHATLGEITSALERVFGRFTPRVL
jgi:methylmalonyl-CoA mutase N-terminal domain/subunit